MPESFADSMFEPPILHVEEEPDKMEARSFEEEEEIESELVGNLEQAPLESEIDEVTVHSAEAIDHPPEITVEVLSKRLDTKLGEICAQIHKGWWSYEWCYRATLTQFHVAIKKKSFEVQDITSLGHFTERQWILDLTDQEENPLAGSLPELGRVIDTHEDGTTCPDTNEPRRSTVHLVCCSDETMASQQALLRKGSTKIEASSNMVFYSLTEDPDKICQYNVTICTALLCNEERISKEISVAATDDTDSKEDDIEVDDAEQEKRRKIPKENESVMQILERTLGGRKPVCLQSLTGGWWTFEFCQGQSIRQFHEAIGTTRDKHGTPKTTRIVETEHNLGLPQTNMFQAIVPEDEYRFIVNATDKKGRRKPYFELEYTNGDICDDEDVRDSAIVAGNSGAQGLSRSSSVRYTCGERYDIQVNEDSTCHYIVDIVVPDLCRHPLFKTPISKKQLFKCLPVEEPDVDASVIFS
jgi:hypothetical protein